MATIFLKWPGFKGSATAKGYEDWSELESVSYDITRDISQSETRATNREAARPEISNMSITRMADAATPKVFEASVAGRPEPVEIHLCQAQQDGTMIPYIRYMLYDCLVSSYQLTGAEYEVPNEAITLAFSKIEYEFDVFKADNKTVDVTIKTMYDLSTNVLA